MTLYFTISQGEKEDCKHIPKALLQWAEENGGLPTLLNCIADESHTFEYVQMMRWFDTERSSQRYREKLNISQTQKTYESAERELEITSLKYRVQSLERRVERAETNFQLHLHDPGCP